MDANRELLILARELLGERRRKADLDLYDISSAEREKLIRNEGNTNLSAKDAAYTAYALNSVDEKHIKPGGMARGLYSNATAIYRDNLLGWFETALIDRANMMQVRGLGISLSGFVKDIPEALIKGRPPDINMPPKAFEHLNLDKLPRAAQRIMATVKSDAIDDGIWQQSSRPSSSTTGIKLEWDKDEREWFIPVTRENKRWTWANKRELGRGGYGFTWDRGKSRWYRLTLNDDITRAFDVPGHGPSSIQEQPPTEQEMSAWFFKTWLPKNIGRFSKMFTDFVSAEGVTTNFNFNVSNSGKVNVSLSRGIGSVRDAIIELRQRYIGRQGREPWLEVMSKVIELKRTTETTKALHIIDRMNNLEHSNGMFMERFPANVYSWYMKFLNAKYSAPNASVLAKYIGDADVREIVKFLADENPTHRDWETPQYELMQKEGPEDPGEDWLAKGYPYAPGNKRPSKDDPRVQEDVRF